MAQANPPCPPFSKGGDIPGADGVRAASAFFPSLKNAVAPSLEDATAAFTSLQQEADASLPPLKKGDRGGFAVPFAGAPHAW